MPIAIATHVATTARVRHSIPVMVTHHLAVAGDCRERVSNDYDCTIAVHGCGKDATYHHAPGQSEWVKIQGR